MKRKIFLHRKGPARILFQYKKTRDMLICRHFAQQKNVPVKNIKHLHILPSMKCNQRCHMCFQTDFLRKMDPSVYLEKLLPVFVNLDDIIFQGGEPTISQEVRAIIKITQQSNPCIRFSILTNGKLFDDRWQDIFLIHGNTVNFSINAATRDTYDTITDYGNWPRVIRNLTDFIQKKQSRHSRVQIASSMVIIEDNLFQLSDFIEFSRNLGVNIVRFFFDINLLPTNFKLVKEEIKKAEQLKKKFPQLHIEGLENFRAWVFDEKMPEIRCSSPFDSLFVDVGGEVSFCCLMNKTLGNLRFQSIDAIWNSPRAKEIRSLFREKDYRYCGFYCHRPQ